VIVAVAVGRHRGDTLRAKPESLVRLDPDSRAVKASVPLGAVPSALAVAPDAVWAASATALSLDRVDVSTNAVTHVGGFRDAVAGVAVGSGAVWVTELVQGVARVDQATQTITETIPLREPTGVGDSANAIAYANGSLWVGVESPSRLAVVRLAAATGAVVARVPIGILSEHSVAADATGAWVSDQLDNVVVRVSARTNRVIRRVVVGAPSAVATGGGALWVASQLDRAVWRIPGCGAPRTKVPLPGEPVGIAFGTGALWVAGGKAGAVWRIDNRTCGVTSRRVGVAVAAVAVGPGAVWIAAAAPS
jgi:hypothetical protein